MLINFLFGAVALIGAACAGVLLLAIVGIRRCDNHKRLTGQPGSKPEAFALRLLAGTRGYGSAHDAGEGR